ncbi:hypothetical protein V8C86DRAFT_1549659 [Haematococcus lacustris]
MVESEEGGICDLCGTQADAAVAECNWLSCTFQQCTGGLYHQACLQQFLKANRLEKNRKTGFRCPRGCGKGSAHTQPCPGRIDKSHPIIPRKRQVLAVEPGTVQPQKDKQVQAKTKEDRAKDSPRASTASSKEATRQAAKPPLPSSPHAVEASKPTTRASQVEKSQIDRVQLAQMKALLQGQIRGTSTVSSSGPALGLNRTAAGSSVGAATSAWGKPGQVTYHDPLPPPPTTHKLSSLIQLQQLIQQGGKAKHIKPGANAASTGSLPAASATSRGTPAHDMQQGLPAVLTPPLPLPGPWPHPSRASHAASTALPPDTDHHSPASSRSHHQHSTSSVDASDIVGEGEVCLVGGAGGPPAAGGADAQPALTKAQRKNLRRVEKKHKRSQATPGAEADEQLHSDSEHEAAEAGTGARAGTGAEGPGGRSGTGAAVAEAATPEKGADTAAGMVGRGSYPAGATPRPSCTLPAGPTATPPTPHPVQLYTLAAVQSGPATEPASPLHWRGHSCCGAGSAGSSCHVRRRPAALCPGTQPPNPFPSPSTPSTCHPLTPSRAASPAPGPHPPAPSLCPQCQRSHPSHQFLPHGQHGLGPCPPWDVSHRQPGHLPQCPLRGCAHALQQLPHLGTGGHGRC